MHKFLVPIDDSDNAGRAFQYALELAKERAIKLYIVTVHPQPDVYGEIHVTETQMAELQLKRSQATLAPALEAAKKADVEHTSEILVGNTATMIVKRAEELRCDGIIMGTQGRGTVGRLFMGSVAVKVVHLTKLPVTLVK
jgi:nucleotide-binding universal stress UspA family protein